MTKFMKKGEGIYFPTSGRAVNPIHDKLPVGTYTINLSMEGYYFEQIADLEPPGKIYGDVHKRIDRVWNTFQKRVGKTTGVMLRGEKGSGKTLEAKLLSLMGLAAGIPTIIFSKPWSGEDFNKLMFSLTQPVIIFIDEFEKVYNDEDAQASLLTLLDGVFTTQKLFLFTCNETNKLSNYFFNRPGRIFYSISYSGLDESFIRHYCQENLFDKTKIDSVVTTSFMFEKFNFDMLQALVEEMNRYNEAASQSIPMLNIDVGIPNSYYDVSFIKAGETEPLQNLTDKEVSAKAFLTHGFIVYQKETVKRNRKVKGSDEKVEIDVDKINDIGRFVKKDIVSFKRNQIIAENESGRLILTKWSVMPETDLASLIE